MASTTSRVRTRSTFLLFSAVLNQVDKKGNRRFSSRPETDYGDSTDTWISPTSEELVFLEHFNNRGYRNCWFFGQMP